MYSMTREAATRIAKLFIERTFPADQYPRIVIIDSATIESPYGWMFVYTTEKALETRDSNYGLIGAGPVLVRREDGRIVEFSSKYTPQAALQAYEQDPARFPPNG